MADESSLTGTIDLPDIPRISSKGRILKEPTIIDVPLKDLSKKYVRPIKPKISYEEMLSWVLSLESKKNLPRNVAIEHVMNLFLQKKKNKKGISGEPIPLLFGHLNADVDVMSKTYKNISEYIKLEDTMVIWDKENLVGSLRDKVQPLYLCPKAVTEQKKKGTTHAQVNNKVFELGKTYFYVPHPLYDPKEFLNTYDWPSMVDHWAYAGAEKDPNLVLYHKSLVIPIPSDRPATWQHLNNNGIEIANAGTGKSRMAKVFDIPTTTETSRAGLFGGFPDGKTYKPGFLEGSGSFVIEEISDRTLKEKNAKAGDLMKSLLDYMDLGEHKRAYMQGGNCRGTVTIIMSANPDTKGDEDNFCTPLINFIEQVNGIGQTFERFGRRFGMLIVGKYKQIEDYKPYPAQQLEIINSIVKTVIQMRQSTIYTHFMSHQSELTYELPDYQALLWDFKSNLNDYNLREFISGMAISTRKVRMAAFRVHALNNLDLIYNQDIKGLAASWRSEQDEYIQQIITMNTQALDNLSEGNIDKHMTQDGKFLHARQLRDEGYSYQEIEDITGIPHSTLYRNLDSKKKH